MKPKFCLILGLVIIINLFYVGPTNGSSVGAQDQGDWYITTQIPIEAEVVAVELSADGSVIYTASHGIGNVKAYDTTLFNEIASIHLSNISNPGLGFPVMLPDQSFLIAGGERTELFFLDPQTLAVKHAIEHSEGSGPHARVVVTGDSKLAIGETPGSSKGRLYFYDLTKDPPILDGSLDVAGNPGRLALTPDESQVYVQIFNNGGGVTGAIRVFDVALRTEVDLINVGGASGDLAMDPTRNLAYFSTSNGLAVIDITTQNVVAIWPITPPYTSLRYDPVVDLLVGARPGALDIISPSQGQVIQSIAISGYVGVPKFSPDGKRLYVPGFETGLLYVLQRNRPPSVNVSDALNVEEGSFLSVSATGEDPDNDPLTYAWDLDNDGSFETPGQTVTFSAAGLDGPSSYPVAVQVTDTGGLTATDQAIVNVLNVAPSVGPITAPMDPVQVNTVINTSANFTDPGILDTHTTVWDWGDNTTSAGVVDETNGSGTTTGSHSYTTPGVYTIKVTVTDDDGDSGDSIYQYVVVYDPNDGFVTGGGWIDSPEGAYIANATLIGKANFGFVSKYKKGATVPTGVTEFQFKVADLNFHSESYDWLVVAGAKAQFKGIGTINGDGAYKFLLAGVDADINNNDSFTTDRFRIKIWTEDADGNETVIYDNGLSAAIDDDNATTEIGGGSIVIHNK